MICPKHVQFKKIQHYSRTVCNLFQSTVKVFCYQLATGDMPVLCGLLAESNVLLTLIPSTKVQQPPLAHTVIIFGGYEHGRWYISALLRIQRCRGIASVNAATSGFHCKVIPAWFKAWNWTAIQYIVIVVEYGTHAV